MKFMTEDEYEFYKTIFWNEETNGIGDYLRMAVNQGLEELFLKYKDILYPILEEIRDEFNDDDVLITVDFAYAMKKIIQNEVDFLSEGGVEKLKEFVRKNARIFYTKYR